MKRVVEIEGAGLESMLGEKIVLLCSSYFYTGTLKGVNDDHVELEDAQLVYDTGAWTTKGWADAQSLSGKVWRVMRQSIESWGTVK